MLDMMSRQPLQEHFLLLGEFDDRTLLSIQGGGKFKDAICKPLGTMRGVDPVVVGLQRRDVRRVGRCHKIDELGPQTSRDRQGWGGGLIDRYKLIGHNLVQDAKGDDMSPGCRKDEMARSGQGWRVFPNPGTLPTLRAARTARPRQRATKSAGTIPRRIRSA